jgi:hypothetical protein
MSTQPYDPQHVAFLASEIARHEQQQRLAAAGLKRLRASLKREQAKAAK